MELSEVHLGVVLGGLRGKEGKKIPGLCLDCAADPTAGTARFTSLHLVRFAILKVKRPADKKSLILSLVSALEKGTIGFHNIFIGKRLETLNIIVQ